MPDTPAAPAPGPAPQQPSQQFRPDAPPITVQPAGAPPAPPPGASPGTEIRKPDLQVLLQDLATSHRTLFQERRDAERRIAEERERSRWEQDRIRTELGDRIRDSERQNEVLVRTLGRLQGENERLREEVAIMRAKGNGHAETPATPPAAPQLAPAPTAPPKPMGTPVHKASFVSVVPPQNPLGGTVRLVEAPGSPTAP